MITISLPGASSGGAAAAAAAAGPTRARAAGTKPPPRRGRAVEYRPRTRSMSSAPAPPHEASGPRRLGRGPEDAAHEQALRARRQVGRGPARPRADLSLDDAAVAARGFADVLDRIV